MGRRTAATLAVTLAAFLAPASAALADAVSGSGADPANDTSDAAHDIVGLSVSYDAGGSLTATTTLRAAPAAGDRGLVLVALGRRGASGCATGGGAAIDGTLDPAQPQARWGYGGGTGDATASVAGSAVTLSATAPGLAGGSFDCAVAETLTVTGSGGTSVDDDMAATPVALAAPAPVPTATPAPSATPAASPAPTPAATPKPAPKTKPAPLLALKAPAPRSLKRNRWYAVKVTVANNGTAAATKVTLRASAGKGTSFKHRTLALKTIKRGKSKRVGVRLRLTKKAAKTSTLKLSAAAKGVKQRATASVVLQIGKPKAIRKPAPKGGGPSQPAKAPLAGLYFTHVEISTMSSNSWSALAFLDDHWAYEGIPEGGLPTCSGPAPGKDSTDGATPGCVPYGYDPATGALTIAGKPETIDAKLTTVSLDGEEYDAAPLIPAGTTLSAALKAIDVSGFWPNQGITIRYLSMAPNGNFAISSSSFGTFGGLPGMAGFGDYSVVPPDERGSYVFGPNGDLHLNYADGHSDVRMTAILRDHQTGSADPAVDGFLFGGEQFYKPDDGDGT